MVFHCNDKPLLSGQPPLSSHLPEPWGWPTYWCFNCIYFYLPKPCVPVTVVLCYKELLPAGLRNWKEFVEFASAVVFVASFWASAVTVAVFVTVTLDHHFASRVSIEKLMNDLSEVCLDHCWTLRQTLPWICWIRNSRQQETWPVQSTCWIPYQGVYWPTHTPVYKLLRGFGLLLFCLLHLDCLLNYLNSERWFKFWLKRIIETKLLETRIVSLMVRIFWYLKWERHNIVP